MKPLKEEKCSSGIINVEDGRGIGLKGQINVILRDRLCAMSDSQRHPISYKRYIYINLLFERKEF